MELKEYFRQIDAASSTDDSNGSTENKMLKEMAKEIFLKLPNDPHYPAAADQKQISEKGNFVVPEAPNE